MNRFILLASFALFTLPMPALALQKKAAPKCTSPRCQICDQLRSAAQGQGSATHKLDKLLKTQWDYAMKEYPESATFNGYPGQNDRWTDLSLTAIAERKRVTQCELKTLKLIPRAKLQGESRINYDLYERNLNLALEGQRFPDELLIMNHMGGLQMDVADTLEANPKANLKDYNDMIHRLEKVPELEQQTEILLHEGLKRGITPIKMFLARVPPQFDRMLTEKVSDSPLYAPFKQNKGDLKPEEFADVQARAQATIRDQVYPAFKRMRDFVITDYIPGARESLAWSSLPDGTAWYAYDVKSHTTTDMTPDQLHDLGLKEVARIQTEMEAIKAQVQFKGDLKAFHHFLMTDKRFYFTDRQQLLTAFRDIAKTIDPELPRQFKTLPRLTYGVREMALYKSAEAPAAYYVGGSLESGRAGYFEANTSDLPGRPKWGMEALTLHEAVPGHHLQIAISQELQGIPEFRRFGGYTAFIEGWGLYAEGLGADLGLYQDAYSKYGQLSYEMWRAIRLVLDTGLHAKDWTRQQAIDYFAEHMPKSPTEIAIEVDRYLSIPGQALAYKVGQLKFVELREQAKVELGAAFDIREFHDELLKHGALPMNVVEKTIRDWIAAKKKSSKSKKES